MSRFKEPEGLLEKQRSKGIDSLPQNSLRRSLSEEALDGDPAIVELRISPVFFLEGFVTDVYGTLSLIRLGVFGDCKFAYISNQL
ncbi:hypothetical protein TNCV_4752101 [Trichonephila clavipes]|nr:hypothetical protein TNCV_4752101 [Trichonephila clavipes]